MFWIFIPLVAAVHVTTYADPFCLAKLKDNQLAGSGNCEDFSFLGSDSVANIKMQCSALTEQGNSTQFKICESASCTSPIFPVCFDDRPFLPPPGSCSRMKAKPNIVGLGSLANMFHFTYTCGPDPITVDTSCVKALQLPPSLDPALTTVIVGIFCRLPIVRDLVADYLGRQGSIVSRLFNLEFTDTFGLLSVLGLSSPINFTLDYDPALLAAAGGSLSCEWRNGSIWENSGCNLTNQDTGNHTATCSCNHATEFALVARRALIAPTPNTPTPPTAPTAPTAPTIPAPTTFSQLETGAVSNYSNAFYGVDVSFSIIFALIAVVALVQSVRLLLKTTEKTIRSPVLWQHIALATISFLRMVQLSVRASEDGADVNIALILSTIPYIVSFAIFLYCVTSWAKMSFFASNHQGAKRIDIGLGVGLFVLLCLQVGFPIGVAQSASLETQIRVAEAATWTMAIVMMTLCVMILGFGLYLANAVQRAPPSKPAASSSSIEMHHNDSLANKISFVAVAFSVCFLGESLCLICSISEPFVRDLEQLATITGVFLMFHAASLAILLVMLWKAVEVRSAARKVNENSSAATMSPSRSFVSFGRRSDAHRPSTDGARPSAHRPSTDGVRPTTDGVKL